MPQDRVWPGFEGAVARPRTRPKYRRSFARTWLVSFLFLLIPLVGIGMAVMYWHTRDDDAAFDAGEGAELGLMVSIVFAGTIGALWLLGALVLGMLG